MMTIAVIWCHLNHLRLNQGPVVFQFWPNHGIHVFDLIVAGVEILVVVTLSATLVWGFRSER